MSQPQLGDIVAPSDAVGNSSSVFYSSVSLHGHEYHVGDSAYFSPDSFTFTVKHPAATNKSKQEHAQNKQVLLLGLVIVGANFFKN